MQVKMYITIALCVFINYNMEFLNFWGIENKYLRGLGHKSWQLSYFVDICERITNVYVSCGMSAGIVCMQNNRWLCDSYL